ncbi:helix-turn-helix domain-containing protein, partial [Andreprevotia chitinilytica]
MPWKEYSTMSSRHEFVLLAQAPGANVRALCHAFNISPKTGYKWLARFAEHGAAGLQDRSRRPLHSPARSSSALEALLLALHDAYP